MRILWLCAGFLGGLGVIAYIAAMFIVPRDPAELPKDPQVRGEQNRLLLWGLGLAAFGSLLFFHNLGWLFPFGFWGLFAATGHLLFPIVFVLVGFVLVVASRRVGEGDGALVGERRLVRVPGDRMLGGVCAGIGRYFGADSSLVRLVWVVGTLLSLGAGLLLYLVLLVVMPLEDDLVSEAGRREGPIAR